MALLPRLVGEARLGPANALLHTVQDLGVVVGPAIGAVLLAVAPNSVAFLVNALTFAVSAALIWTIRRPAVKASARAVESARLHLLQGLRTVRATPFVVPLLIVIAMAELTYGAQTVQLVVYAARRLDLGAAGYGYLLAAGGAGGLLSAAVNPRLTTSNHISGIVVGSGALYCATQLAYARVSELVLALAITLIGGAGFVACEVVAETTLARVAPAESLGRLMGVVEAVAVGAMVAGALLASLLLASTSLAQSFTILGGATLLATLGCLGWLRGLDALSRRRAEELAARVAVVERLPIAAGRLAARPGAARVGVAVLPAAGRRRRRRPGRARPRLLRDRRWSRRRQSRRPGGRPARPGRLLRRAGPARQRAQERDRHHRGIEHALAPRRRGVARDAPDRAGDAVGARPLERAGKVIGSASGNAAGRRSRLERRMIRFEPSGRKDTCSAAVARFPGVNTGKPISFRNLQTRTCRSPSRRRSGFRRPTRR